MLRGQSCWSIAILSCVLLAACGGSAPPAQEPTANTGPVIPEKSEVTPPAEEDVAKADAEAEPKKAPKEEVPEPAFTPDMSVEEAIKAVPQSAERLNVDQETLSKPLEQESLYEPCKPGSTHFTL